jgi:uncharacterized protein YjbI with pentapeptide repeats
MKKEIYDINGILLYSGDFESDKTCLEDAVKNNVRLQGAKLQGAYLQEANLRGADLRRANLNGTDLDFSVLPLWCGGQFKADKRICKQILAHAKRIMELSEEGSPELHELMAKYIKGWHRESEF